MSIVERSATARLKCEAGRSMPPHEAGIFIHGVGRDYESLVDAELVRLDSLGEIQDDDLPASIEVQVLERSGDNVLVELPRQVISGGRRIWVPTSQLVK